MIEVVGADEEHDDKEEQLTSSRVVITVAILYSFVL